ncbi:MAG: 2-dehydropantoate 2-reductase N-terminal domain-containing protein [Acidimicrobiales bacterium]|nr:2-dehydropantoate 2-reductase N-terminal domain-containing protein [Acidimicrobiales bacterium]
MRFVVYGAGAVGGVVGGRLAEHGHDVTLIARGAHLDAVKASGLRIDSPRGSVTVEVPAVGSPSEVDWRGDEVVMLGMKSQDTVPALRELRDAAPPSIAVVCLQNGVVNERETLRFFGHVYGVTVMAPTGHLEPGVVQAWAHPVAAILDLGRYPNGVDDTARSVADAISSSAMVSEPRDDIMAWKHRKLIMNLANAVQALFGRDEEATTIGSAARREARAVFEAAGIDVVSGEQDRERRGDILQIGAIGDVESRPGGSTWQSLARGQGSVETDYLNGEIVLLGRLHGVATPCNALLQRWMARAVAGGAEVASHDPREFLAELEGA